MKTLTLIPLLFVTLLSPLALLAQEESVKPGINEKFLDRKLKPDEWVQRFEVESREVYSARMEVLEACGIEPGDFIADVGAGTGLYTQVFAEATGAEGWVYAVDINPRFLEHIQRQAAAHEHANVTTVLCPEKSIALPHNSVDVVFICDTYHHFEYPAASLASILTALRPGGKLVVIDFERIPGVTSDWIMNHVRAGKEVFSQEIVDAGFTLETEKDLEGLEENYFLIFRKPDEA